MNNPKISIIVPIFNTERFLHKCLESLINQSYRKLEIILVNDGSTDKSFDVCKDFASKDNRITLINKQNGGVASARNAALEKITGDYVGFIDSDDYADNDMFEKLLIPIVESRADIAECGYYRESMGMGASYEFATHAEETIGNYQCSSDYVRNSNSYYICCNKLYRSSILSNIRFFDLKFSEDYLFNVYAFYSCRKKITIGSSYYHYIRNDDSATNSVFKEEKLDIISSGKHATAFYEQHFPELCKYAMLYIVHNAMKLYESIPRKEVLDNKWIEQYLIHTYNRYFGMIRSDLTEIVQYRKMRIAYWIFSMNPNYYCIIQRIRQLFSRS